ncbi:MAG: HAD-IIIC family phosphatase [Patescibacteria group bacterium]
MTKTPKKLFLFDCDQTLWKTTKSEYLSRIASKFYVKRGVLIRKSDGVVFYPLKEVKKIFTSINAHGGTVGIVSDNKPEVVISVLKLLDWWKFIDKEAFNVRFWVGPCPKEIMVLEILSKPKFSKLNKKNVYWFDDGDYSKVAKNIGVNFIRVCI